MEKKLATSLLVFNVTMNIYLYFYFDIALGIVTVWLIFVDIYQFNHTFLHTHIEAHTHKHNCMISAQETLREPGTGAWFGGAEEWVLLETKA